MESMIRVQILIEALYISLRGNALGKGMNLSVLLSNSEKIGDQTVLFSLSKPFEEKENSELKPLVLLLKIDFVSYPARRGGFGQISTKLYIYIYVCVCVCV